MSDKAMNFLKAGISATIGLCSLGAKIFGTTTKNWPYAAAIICAVITIAYVKQALDQRR